MTRPLPSTNYNKIILGYQLGHCTDFNSTSVLNRAARCMDRLEKEATEIRLNTRNFNIDSSIILSWAWQPMTKMLSNQKAGPGRVST